MKKEENNVRAEINSRIIEQFGGVGSIPATYNELKTKLGWTTPQPLYNVRNGEANLTTTTLYDIGTVDKTFSADMAIYGEYRLPLDMKEMQDRLNAFEIALHQKNEEMRKVEIRAERAESLNELLQTALKESMKANGANFQTGDINRLLADDILMMYLYPASFNVGAFLE